jgi:glycosyltransferase involved in cell wall biosynthesis
MNIQNHFNLGIDASSISIGGGAIHLIRIIENYDINKFNTIYIWGFSNLLDKIPDRIDIIKIPIPNIYSNIFLRIFWQIYTFSFSKNININLLFVPGGLYLGLFRPFVTMFQNMQVFEMSELNREFFSVNWIRLILLRLGQSYTFKRAHGLICLSRHSVNFLGQNYKHIIKSSNITLIKHGIDPDFFNIERHSLNHSINPIVIRFLYVSTIKSYKHQWNIIQAISGISIKNVVIELHLVGGGDSKYLAKMDAAIRNNNNINFKINYHGDVNYKNLKIFYENANCFIYSSSCETFGIALLEAMSSALPIACSNMGPASEILKDSGLYFNPLNIHEIKIVVEKLINSLIICDKYNNLQARKYAEEYSWHKCSRETFSFLKLILAERLK